MHLVPIHLLPRLSHMQTCFSLNLTITPAPFQAKIQFKTLHAERFWAHNSNPSAPFPVTNSDLVAIMALHFNAKFLATAWWAYSSGVYGGVECVLWRLRKKISHKFLPWEENLAGKSLRREKIGLIMPRECCLECIISTIFCFNSLTTFLVSGVVDAYYPFNWILTYP